MSSVFLLIGRPAGPAGLSPETSQGDACSGFGPVGCGGRSLFSFLPWFTVSPWSPGFGTRRIVANPPLKAREFFVYERNMPCRACTLRFTISHDYSVLTAQSRLPGLKAIVKAANRASFSSRSSTGVAVSSPKKLAVLSLFPPQTSRRRSRNPSNVGRSTATRTGAAL